MNTLPELIAAPLPARDPAGNSLDLAVVLPTFNERENVAKLIAKLEDTLQDLRWELIFVDDDSPDGTAGVVLAHARRDRRIRLLHRVGRRGLSSACIEGILATSANYVAVMDADMQHDETLLPRMLAQLRAESLDLIVATRNAVGGSMGEFSPKRVLLSRFGRRISRMVCHCDVSDPMSGFFMLDRSFFMKVVHDLQGGGFKILVDILASSERPVRFGEIGYCFGERRHGASKLDVNTVVEYLFLVINKLTGGVIPTRFAVFSLVGTAGLATHFACLTLLLYGFHLRFFAAQTAATYMAMTENFFLNNLITYRDRSLRGVRLFYGLLSFWLACSFGAWSSVVFARALLQQGAPWYLAGGAGIVLSSIWNYSMSSLFTWQRPQKLRAAAQPDPAEVLAVHLKDLR